MYGESGAVRPAYQPNMRLAELAGSPVGFQLVEGELADRFEHAVAGAVGVLELRDARVDKPGQAVKRLELGQVGDARDRLERRGRREH